MINGRKLIWITSSTLPNVGITDWKHIQVIEMVHNMSVLIGYNKQGSQATSH